MEQILEFVVAHMGYLWRDARFRITGSEVTTSNGGNSIVVIESELLRMRLMTDRRQLFIDFQPVHTGRPKEWYSVDIIRRFYRGERETSGVLDASYAGFVGDHLDEIESLFSPNQWEITREELIKLERKRSKEMFG